ncbi:porin [Flavobacterium sp.]|uniref:porin n=1 Tax=Flavobacterium sp. TaxID=239 RepID=UPI002617CE19|nr:porin [Flavobacterium sp.]
MKKITLFLMLFITLGSNAQEIIRTKKDNDLKLSSLPYYNYGKGLGITSPDSLFQFNIRFRIQNRVTYFDNENQDPYFEGQVRRLRLRFDGFVGNPKWLYVIQLSFGAGDVGVERTGENLNVIRDAIVYYRPSKKWQLGFGVTKLPGTRQTVNSSGALQLSDRSVNNMRFGIDRDFGFHFANLNEVKDRFSYSFKAAVTMGEGRNWTTNNPNIPVIKDDNGLSYTGKIELLPFGTFKKDGHYFEGDILREPKPKVMVSGAYNFNAKARKASGQTGDLLLEARDMSSVLLDAIAKYNGWALMATYMSRTSKDPVTQNPLDATQTRAVFTGHGMDYQLSYVFPSKYELIARFSTQKVANEIRAYSPNTDQFTLGLNKYIWEHALKLQGEITNETLQYANGNSLKNWYLRFQIEVGI